MTNSTNDPLKTGRVHVSGLRVVALRVCKNWTQKELAQHSGISLRTIQSWESPATTLANTQQYHTFLSNLEIDDPKQLDSNHEQEWIPFSTLFSETTRNARGFKEIWIDYTDWAVAARKTRELLRGGGSPSLMFLRASTVVDIGESGDAEILFHRSVVNIGDADVAICQGSLWFEYPQIEDLGLRGTVSDGFKLEVRITQDYGNLKEYICCFSPPIPPLQLVDYSIRYNVPSMFRENHYWSSKVQQLTVDMNVTIRHRKQCSLKSCRLEQVNHEEAILRLTPDLHLNQSEGLVELNWKKRVPTPYSSYKIYWDFNEQGNK